MRSIFVRNLSNLNEKGIKWKDFYLPNSATGLSAASWSDKLNMLCMIVYGEKNEVITTTDFEKWNTRYLPKTTYWRDITRSPELNMFCIVGDKSSVATSSDGINWVQKSIPDSNKDLYYIRWAPKINKFIIFQYYGSPVYISSVGNNWSKYDLPFNDTWKTIYWSDELSKFYVFGYSKILLTSSDGINWVKNPRNIELSSFGEYLAYSDKLNLFCTAYDSNILTSSDCITWNSISTSIHNVHNLSRVLWIPEFEIFVVASKGSNSIFISNDGINWEETKFNSRSSWNYLMYSDKMKSIIILPYSYYPNSPAKIGKLTK